MKLLPHSIRWRIQAWHGLILVLVLLGFSATAYRLRQIDELRHLDSELEGRLALLNAAIARGGPPSGPGQGGEERMEQSPPAGLPPPTMSDFGAPPNNLPLPSGISALFDATASTPYYLKFWSREGDLIDMSRNAPAGITLPDHTERNTFHTRNGYREGYHFTPPGECLLVGVSETAMHQAMRHFAGWLLACGGGILALGLAGGWWLTSRAISPISEMSDTARRVADGRLEERISGPNSASELGQLASVLNSTFAKLEAAFEEQKRFTSDAAHELRTPASVILAQTQLALSRPRSVEELRETITTIRRATQRMQGLIESLLTLARLDGQSEPLKRREFDLAELAREQLHLIRPLAEERGITLRGEFKSTPCAADPDRITQVLTNLLSNAVKYSRKGDFVQLTTRRENGHAIVRVADTGIGIAPEHLSHLFDRFYRADASRNRATGGAGLGLAICKTIAEAHGGTISVESTIEKGTKFTMTIPAGKAG